MNTQELLAKIEELEARIALLEQGKSGEDGAAHENNHAYPIPSIASPGSELHAYETNTTAQMREIVLIKSESDSNVKVTVEEDAQLDDKTNVTIGVYYV